MNKVVSIEIASQVFWMDEQAYEILQSYLQKIHQQLADDDCADEIFKDIELRIAELLFALSSNEKKAIIANQLDVVIQQVGYIDDGDDSENDDKGSELNFPKELPRKSYLDPQNKILAGVCAGLSIRLGLSAFIIRMVFIALIALFGLGIALYLIFWISLESNSSRNTALAAQGKSRTAKEIASFEAPKAKPLIQLQRFIFLPFSIIGTLLFVVMAHFKNRRQGYFFIIKNIVALALFILTLVLCSGLFELNQSRLFFRPVSWLLSAAAMYLIVLILAVYLREFYISKSEKKVEKKLKTAALIPVGIISMAIVYVNYAHYEDHNELVEKSFSLQSKQLAINFNEQDDIAQFAKKVSYQIRTNDSQSQQVKIYINYASEGNNQQQANNNIQSIEYFYTFNNDVLTFNKYWTLKDGRLNRGQHINVVIEVSQDTHIASSWLLDINQGEQDYEYDINQYNSRQHASQKGYYQVSGEYIHEVEEYFSNKLSTNETSVLKAKFCQEYFISEAWSCRSNIRNKINDNYRFDLAFEQDTNAIESIREFLQPNRSLFVSNLTEINELVKSLTIEYKMKSEFQQYIEHLLTIKASLKASELYLKSIALANTRN